MDFYLIIPIVGAILLAISICICICYYKKACKPPKFEEVPVTGYPSGLSVIPVSINNHFLRSESTILKLREKNLSWTGDDCTVKVLISLLRLRKFVTNYTAYCVKLFSLVSYSISSYSIMRVLLY